VLLPRPAPLAAAKANYHLGMNFVRGSLIGLVLFLGGVVSGIIFHAHHWNSFAAGPTGTEAAIKVLLENPRVTVATVDLGPGARRPPRTRASDELVLFCEEAHYQTVDAQGRTEARDRRPGAVVWHAKGEQAPALVNPGTRPVRLYSIALK
jgi:hypothetical protein